MPRVWGTWHGKARQLSFCIWASVRDISKNSHMSHLACLGCKCWSLQNTRGHLSNEVPLCAYPTNGVNFGGDCSVMNSTLCGARSTFSAVSRLPFWRFSWNFTPSTVCQLPTNWQFGCDRPIMDTLLGEQSAFLAVFRLPFQDFPETLHLALYAN